MEYTKQNFKSGQILTAEALNNMDSSLESAVNELNNKQEKITNGSIPLSALATEVKDKIKNADGADWNARRGEAGYIKNKPFEFIDKHENAFYYDTDVNPNYIIWDSPSASDSPVIQILDYDGFPQYIFLGDKTDGSLYNMDNIFSGSLNYKWLTDINNLGIEIPSYILNEGEDVTTYLNELIKCSTGGIIRKIPDVYLPDTVVKTTPQSLSTNDKNQALSNLGIDPVVLKYLCNPFIIKVETECYVPEELVGSPANSAGLSKEAYEWKYLNPAMYIGYDDMSGNYYTVMLSDAGELMTLEFSDHQVFIDKDFKIFYE